MTKRKNQTSQDISELAARFRAAWNTGQVLRSWLKIHGPEIQELAKTGHWSWENLGRVLTEAGITYQTGTPWTGENLRRNLLRAQLPGKRELKLLRGSDGPPEPAPEFSGVSGPASARSTGRFPRRNCERKARTRRARVRAHSTGHRDGQGACGTGKPAAPPRAAKSQPRRTARHCTRTFRQEVTNERGSRNAGCSAPQFGAGGAVHRRARTEKAARNGCWTLCAQEGGGRYRCPKMAWISPDDPRSSS